MYLKVDFILFSWYSKNKAREWWCFIKIQIEKWSFYPWHDTLPLFWKSIQWDTHASQINTGQVIHGIINMLWCLLTWSHVCFRPLLDFLTQSSSGILQDPCVCFWSSILHHHITAPSTGYQLCEPPPEPQRVLTSNRRKGKRKKNVKKGLISFYWYFAQIITSCQMVYMWWFWIWEKQVELKENRWERIKMGDWHLNKGIREKWMLTGG